MSLKNTPLQYRTVRGFCEGKRDLSQHNLEPGGAISSTVLTVFSVLTIQFIYSTKLIYALLTMDKTDLGDTILQLPLPTNGI